MQNLVELSYMARQADKTLRFGGKLHARTFISLERLVGGYLDKHLPKGDARTSDWEAKLSNEQLECAFSSATSTGFDNVLTRCCKRRALRTAVI